MLWFSVLLNDYPSSVYCICSLELLPLSQCWFMLQVLQERGESTSRHGRATFSVLLFQVSIPFLYKD